jgi:hypothetical protein
MDDNRENIVNEGQPKKWHFDVPGAPAPRVQETETVQQETVQAEQPKVVSEQPKPDVNPQPQPSAAPKPDAQPEEQKKGKKGWKGFFKDKEQRRKVGRKLVPVVLIVMLFGIVMIYFRYRVENLANEKVATERRILELSEAIVKNRTEYQRRVKISQVVETLEETGVGLQPSPPKVLTDKQEVKKGKNR